MSTDQPTGDRETLLEFPCEFAVKAFGKHSDSFQGTVLALVAEHVDGLSDNAASSRSSNGGKFLAVTVSFTASSKAQLDAIYQDLSDHPAVLMAL